MLPTPRCQAAYDAQFREYLTDTLRIINSPLRSLFLFLRWNTNPAVCVRLVERSDVLSRGTSR